MPQAPDYSKAQGKRQEARILELLAAGPTTAQALADVMQIGRENVNIYLKRMRIANRVHVCDNRPNVTGRPAPVWAVGKGINAEYVPKRCPTPIIKMHERIARARELLAKPHTSSELAEKMHVSQARARKYIQQIRESAPPGKSVIRICEWRYQGQGDLARVYVLSAWPDKPKPKQTRKQRYAAERSDPERYARILQKGRMRYALKKAKAKPNGIFAALGL